MHTIELLHKKPITLEFPASIWEMTQEQYVFFCKRLMMWHAGIIPLQRLKVYLVYEFLHLKRSKCNDDELVENIHSLTALCDGYFTSEKRNGKDATIVRQNFINNLIPVIDTDFGPLIGPQDALLDCSYGEVGYANNNFLDFSRTGDIKYLNALVTALYRPKIDEERIAFNQKELKHAPLVEAVPEEIKFGVYLWFASCMKWVSTNQSLDIGGGVSVDVSVLFKQSKSAGKNFGFVGVIYSLAESQVFGDAEKTAAQNYYDILIRMAQMHAEAEKLKRDAKRHKSK